MTMDEIKAEIKRRKAKKKLEKLLGFPAELQKVNQSIKKQEEKIKSLKHDEHMLKAFWKNWTEAHLNDDTMTMGSLLNVWGKHKVLKGSKLLRLCKDEHLKICKKSWK